MLALFNDEVRFVSPDSDMTLDRDGLRKMLGWDAATGTVMSHEALKWEDDIVRGRFTERNEFYELLGIEERHYDLTFSFENKRIREIRLVPVADAGPTLDEAMRPFLDWAATRHASALGQIYPDRRFVFDEISADKWLTLLRQWRATQEG